MHSKVILHKGTCEDCQLPFNSEKSPNHVCGEIKEETEGFKNVDASKKPKVKPTLGHPKKAADHETSRKKVS